MPPSDTLFLWKAAKRFSYRAVKLKTRKTFAGGQPQTKASYGGQRNCCAFKLSDWGRLVDIQSIACNIGLGEN